MNKNNNLPGRCPPDFTARSVTLALLMLLAGCASAPPAVVIQPANGASLVVEDAGPVSPLTYYQILQRMTPAQISRERMALAALPGTPNTQVRTAMVLGYPRTQQDLTKALSLLDSVLKSTDPAAIALHPLARLLADNYGERLRLDTQLEKQGQQLKESQRKAVELQEKIDGLADIERTLPQRPRATRSGSGAVR